MSVGFVMLVHTALDRAAQVARHLAASGCPVVIHADRKVKRAAFEPFRDGLADTPGIDFASRRHACEWGMWGIVGATLDASEDLLARHPGLRHVYLCSGACLPLRPLPELKAYLAARPRTDFIESVTIDDVSWTKGGFDHDRFALRFPVSFRKRRRLFDLVTGAQRRLGMARRPPESVVPHLGSQWWCLTRATLEAILTDPRRAEYDRFFRSVWIPDEGYFQSLVRLHSGKVESRSLTLSKFDHFGRPHSFYDDHLQLLRRSDCFFARKIWPRADRLYASFLSNDPRVTKNAEPNPGKIDRLFSRATDQRVQGRPGLVMQSRFPAGGLDTARTAAPYSVFCGFAETFEGFEAWLAKATGLRVHGHLFAPSRAEFAGGARVYNGGIADSATLRDYNPEAFLANLVWATRGERQCFMFGPADAQAILRLVAGDHNAQVSIIAGAWALTLHARERTGDLAGAALRQEAARLQRIELEQLRLMRSNWVKARVRAWSLAEFTESPMENLAPILDELAPRAPRRPTEAPVLASLEGFGAFLQRLKNDGMNLHLPGDFPAGVAMSAAATERPRPYLVR